MLEINDVTEMKNIINGLISRLYTDENIISELDNTAIETLITEQQKETEAEKNARISKDCFAFKCVTRTGGIPGGEEREKEQMIYLK